VEFHESIKKAISTLIALLRGKGYLWSVPINNDPVVAATALSGLAKHGA
jgi:hypothetical protein